MGGAGGGAGEEGGGGKTGGGGGEGGGGGVEASVEDGFELGDAPDFHIEVLSLSYDVVFVAWWWYSVLAGSIDYN